MKRLVSYWYCKQWKSPRDHSKGTVWTYIEKDAFKHAGIPRLEEGMNLMMGGHRPAVCMRGIKW